MFVSSEHVERIERRDRCCPSQPKIQNQIKTKTPIKNGETRCIPTSRSGCKNSENLVYERVPERRDSHASSSREPSFESTPARSVDLGKTHCLYSLLQRPKLRDLPEDQNYKSTEQTTQWRRRTSCRKFGDLITADHKVLSDNCESRNNHRYAVVVQDLSTQWIQSYPCKTKTSQETQRSLHKFLEPTRKPKVIYTDNSLGFGKACEDLSPIGDKWDC